MNKVSVFEQQIVRKVDLPAKAYVGYATGLLYKGREMVVMAESVEAVIALCAGIRPSLTIDLKAIFPVALVHDRHINRETEDEEL